MSEAASSQVAHGVRLKSAHQLDAPVHSGRALGSLTGRPIVVVLGMHRSGTSLLANMLHVLGVDMADTTDHISPKNAGGFWERPALNVIHDEILAAIGRPLDRPSHVLPFPAAWWRRKDVQALKPKLIDYVREQLEKSTNPWGFKDPRTCRLLPLWWEIFRELDLKPIYVHAVRSPAEAAVSMSQKNSARKLSIANSELMWLAYNYDILKYVTIENPTIIVNYSDWFSAGPDLARSLAEELGVGKGLSDEDIVECVSSIVQTEYRHQVAGQQGTALGVPIASVLFEAMTASNPLTGPDISALRRQMSFVSLLLKSLSPIVQELEGGANEKASLAKDETLAAMRDEGAMKDARIAKLETDYTTASRKLLAVRESEEKLAVELAEVRAALTAAQSVGATAEVQLKKAVTEAQAAKDEVLAAMRHEGAMKDARITKLETDYTTASRKLLAVRESEEKLSVELAEVRAALIAARSAGAAAEVQLKKAVTEAQAAMRDEGAIKDARIAKLDIDYTTASRKLLAVRESEEKLSVELAEVRAALTAALSAGAAAEIQLKKTVAEAQSAAEDAAEAARADVAARLVHLNEADAAKRRALRHERRARALIQAGKVWRAAYRGETTSVTEADRLRRQIGDMTRRLAVEEDRTGRFSHELAKRNEVIAALLSQAAEAARTVSSSENDGSFVWPAIDQDDSASANLGADGKIERIDRNGIVAWARFRAQPELMPVIEVAIDGQLVAATTCAAVRSDTDGPSADAGWRAEIDWRSIPIEHGGKSATLRIAGTEQSLGNGPVTVPENLRRYHQSPESIAAEVFGDTRTESVDYARWRLAYEGSEDIALARVYHEASKDEWPLITVFIHGRDKLKFVTTIDSLRAQLYYRWEAICFNAEKTLEDLDPRVRVIDSKTIAHDIASGAIGPLISFIEAGDTIAPTALLHLSSTAREAPDAGLIYSDEDMIDHDTGTRGRPYMKGGWNVDLGLAQDYTSRLALIKRDDLPSDLGPDLNGAEVYRITMAAALRPDAHVIHLPFVLYHRDGENRAPSGDYAGAVRALLADTQAKNEGIVVAEAGDESWHIEWPLPKPHPRVSLIVPTRDRIDLLKVCIDGFLHETRYSNLEILIADNGSEEQETLDYLAQLATNPRVRVIDCPGPFNYSTINNMAAAHATGSLIGLMNNDLKVIEPDWLARMAGLAMRPEIGIVGAKLLHGDDTIQHAGVVLGIGIASHIYKSQPGGAQGRNGRLNLPQDMSAVTAACLLMRRAVWDEVGGLDETFPVAYNDIDLCLKVGAAGYRILWSPDVVAYHLESQSRGKDITAEKRDRLNADKARLTERWGERLAIDPFYSPNLSLAHVDARLAFPPRAVPPWRTLQK